MNWKDAEPVWWVAEGAVYHASPVVDDGVAGTIVEAEAAGMVACSEEPCFCAVELLAMHGPEYSRLSGPENKRARRGLLAEVRNRELHRRKRLHA